MLFVRKPYREVIDRFLIQQSALDFSYKEVGATARTPPAGFIVDHTRTKLGEGETVFRSAVGALKNWKQFALGWVEAWPPNTPIRPGETVAVLGRGANLWWLNSCRIIYVVDESGPINRFGFAYGTLPGHIARGEERFLIEWNQADNSVWYDILAFSQPNQLLIRLGYPAVRRAQKRFGRESGAAMLRAVQGAEASPS